MVYRLFRAAQEGRKLTFQLDPYSGAAQKLRKLTLNLDQLMQAGQGVFLLPSALLNGFVLSSILPIH